MYSKNETAFDKEQTSIEVLFLQNITKPFKRCDLKV